MGARRSFRRGGASLKMVTHKTKKALRMKKKVRKRPPHGEKRSIQASKQGKMPHIRRKSSRKARTWNRVAKKNHIEAIFLLFSRELRSPTLGPLLRGTPCSLTYTNTSTVHANIGTVLWHHLSRDLSRDLQCDLRSGQFSVMC